jgi:CubicO group peptidase (beta-lactamase class C family)
MAQITDVDQALRKAAEAREVPGVVAMAATDREVIYQGAFGKRDLGKPDAMTFDSVFWIASMTKAITGTAAMQLVEQGKLALDAPIGKVLPEIAAMQVFEGFDASGKPKLRAAKREITLKHLLTHTAGYCYNIWNAPMGKYMEHAGIPGITTCENKSLTMPLSFDPGEKWEYGINIDWAGKAVEAVSGKKLDAYLKDHIFSALGMTSTGFRLSADMRARLVGMHQRGADGALNPVPFEMVQEPEFHMGGGGLYSTAGDYIRFIQMLLNGGTLGGHRVLKAETVKLMGQNHIGDLNVTPMKTAAPDASNDVDLYPEQDKKWGLSFLINTQRTAEGRSAGSLAWAGLANTYFWIDPARKVGGCILTQLLPFADPKVLGLFAALERGVYASLDGTKAAA